MYHFAYTLGWKIDLLKYYSLSFQRIPRYFDSEGSSLMFCSNCSEDGHVAANCRLERRKKPCFVCGILGHDARKCPQVWYLQTLILVCYVCVVCIYVCRVKHIIFAATIQCGGKFSLFDKRS